MHSDSERLHFAPTNCNILPNDALFHYCNVQKKKSFAFKLIKKKKQNETEQEKKNSSE